ncbi:retrotransposon protein, putative, ty1-copia subclass [Tanacetum coccineum]
MHVIEQPLPPAPEAGAEPNIVAQWTVLYDAHTEIACLMLRSMTPELHRQCELHYPYDKTIGEIHVMLIEYEKGLPKKAEIPQVMMIKSGHIGKGTVLCILLSCRRKGSKLALPVLRGFRIERKLKQGALYLYVGNGVRAQVEQWSYKRVKRNLGHYLSNGTASLAHINKKRIKQLQQDGLLKSTDDESFDKCESCLSGKMTKKPFPHSNERAKDLLGIIHTDVCGPLRHVSRQCLATSYISHDEYSVMVMLSS